MKKISHFFLLVLILTLVLTLSSCFLFEPDSDDSDMNLPDDGASDGAGDGDGGNDGNNAPVIPDVSFSGVSFPDKTVTYNGNAHSVLIEGKTDNIYVTVRYEGNEATNAGEYTAVAKFYYKDIYLEGKDMTAKLTILPASYDMYGIGFGDTTVIYDGKPHSTTIKAKLPDGVRVSYSGNAVTEVGEHTVTANFIGDAVNYEPIPPMTAKIRIIDGPAALGGLSFSDSIVEYDGLDHSVILQGRLTGASASYSISAKRNAGEYECVATVTHSGGSLEMRAVLTILPRKIEVGAEDLTVNYDGKSHSIELAVDEDDLIAGFNITEIGNDTPAIGTHEVIFRFSVDKSKSGNFVFVPEIRRTLTILPPEAVECDGLLFEYDQSQSGYVITGYEGDETHLVIPSAISGSGGISAKVAGIRSGAFMGNEKIEYVYIPEGVSLIGNKAFSGCSSLREVTLTGGKGIGSLAFEDTGLRSIVIPDTVKAIGQGAFRGCSALESITLPFIGGSASTSNKYFGYIFGAPGYVGNASYVPESLRRVVLSDACTIVHAYSFFGLENIEEVVIGKRVSEIGISAFSGCTSLRYLYIPSTVTDIPAAANNYNSSFLGCTSLTLGTSVSAAVDGWGSKWDIISDEERAAVIYGVSYGEYMERVLRLGF